MTKEQSPRIVCCTFFTGGSGGYRYRSVRPSINAFVALLKSQQQLPHQCRVVCGVVKIAELHITVS